MMTGGWVTAEVTAEGSGEEGMLQTRPSSDGRGRGSVHTPTARHRE